MVMRGASVAAGAALLACAAVASGQERIVEGVRAAMDWSGGFTVRNAQGCVTTKSFSQSPSATSHLVEGAIWDEILWLHPPQLGALPICPETYAQSVVGLGFVSPMEVPNRVVLQMNCGIGAGDSETLLSGPHSGNAAGAAILEFRVRRFCILAGDMHGYIDARAVGEGPSTLAANGVLRFVGPLGTGSGNIPRFNENREASAHVTSLSYPAVVAPGLYRLELTFTGSASTPDRFYVLGTARVAIDAAYPVAPPSWADRTGDGSVTLADLLAWLAGPTDANGDGTVDADPYGDDATTLAAILEGQGNGGADCDGNGYPDAYDLAATGDIPSCCGSADFDGDGDEGTDADIEAFFAVIAGGVCPTGACGSIDFDGDGDEGTDFDIEAFFAVIGGQPCPTGTCGSIDFDGDGDEGTDADIEAFFRLIGGGTCEG
jgi:hypothetical protein